VYLRSIKLRGFKSFPEPIEVRLEPGVAVVVGPNGSGKSNVADAIIWAAGSLSPSELRAEKPDDVLFAGAAGRAPAEAAEVELLFDNADGKGPLDYSELAITRRLHRGGEGQYLVNRTAVRRLDLVEILADLGLGHGMHSIIGQGKVEEILSSKPHERRALIEEAAGLAKFKARRHRAELKLARVTAQVERARDREEEVRKRLRPLALQATAAERAEKLRGEIAALQARIAELDLAAFEERLAEAGGRKTAAVLARRRVDEQLESLLAERNEAEEELADAAGRREAALQALYRLRSAADRLELRRESAAGLAARVRREREEPPADPEEAPEPGPAPAELERLALEARAAARDAVHERDTLAQEARTAEQQLAALERSLAERDGLPPAARELGGRLALSLLEVEPGSERAVAAALGPRAAALVAGDLRDGLALLERAAAAGLGSLRVLVRDPNELVLPVVPKDELLAATAPSVTAEGFGYDPERGELWFEGETAEAVLLELEARRRGLEAEAKELAERARGAARAAAEAEQRAGAAEVAFAEVEALRTRIEAAGRRRARPHVLARLTAGAARLDEALLAGATAVGRFEPPLRARVDAGAARAGELGGELRRLGAAEVELRRAAGEAGEKLSAIDVEVARLEAEAGEARRRLEAAGAEPAAGDDREELAERCERLERRRDTLGAVNPLAKEAYDAEKARLEELTAQRADLEASLAELEKLRAELTETVERLFAETFEAVRGNFHEIAGTLFPGGEGRLRLTESDDEEDQPGIEIELRPAGKRVTRLSLLSGGEKALGAISFLFALFLARPCPFYLLDEVEAALDDTNIGRFVELLRRYADRAQFVVITHQKRTMEAADILYGVTMGGDGVSQIVSRRLPRQEAAAAGVA